MTFRFSRSISVALLHFISFLTVCKEPQRRTHEDEERFTNQEGKNLIFENFFNIIS